MRKLLVPIMAILLLSVGAGIGWFAAKQGFMSGPVVKLVAGDPELLSPAPSWETWQYPGSKIHASHTGAGHSLGNIDFGNADRLALTSPDSFDEVWAFYKDKYKLQDPGNSTMTMRFEGGGSPSAMTFKVFDDILAHSMEGPPAKPCKPEPSSSSHSATPWSASSTAKPAPIQQASCWSTAQTKSSSAC